MDNPSLSDSPSPEPARPPSALSPAARRLRSALILALIGAVALGVAGLRGALGSAADSRPSQIVDTQHGGAEPRHAGFRRAHARGLCVSGRFIGSGEAAELSAAPLFGATESPLLGRLSIGGGNPTAPEASAGVRSLAMVITQADGQQWRMAMNTPPVLPVGTPQAFYAQLRALAPDPATGRPDPARLAAFFEAHPESAAFRVGLYGLMLALPLTGWAMQGAAGLPLQLFSFVLPALVDADLARYGMLRELHAWLAYGLLALVLLHAGAALHHAWLRRDGLLARMGFGTCHADDHQVRGGTAPGDQAETTEAGAAGTRCG